MKTNITKFISMVACPALLAVMASSCRSDAPFEDYGEGMVNLKVAMNHEITRSTPDNVDELEKNCLILISGEKGLLHKWQGIDNMPAYGKFYLRYGSYTAEAYAGDSVSASFDKKFYKGLTRFDVQSSTEATAVVLNCRIANVVASVDESTLDPNKITDYTITIGHTRGSLEFNADNVATARGFFMMPSTDTALTYTVAGKDIDGKEFSKQGVISNVQPAHEYVMKFAYKEQENTDGGAFITITIADEPLVTELEQVIYGKPSFAGFEFDIDNQVVGTPGNFSERVVTVAAYNGLKELIMEVDNPSAMNLQWPSIDLMDMSAAADQSLQNAGILFNKTPTGNGDLKKYNIRFRKNWLDALPPSSTEYVVTLKATDVSGKTKTQTFRVANTEEAIVYADPVIIDDVTKSSDNLSVRSTEATLTYSVVNTGGDAATLQYREAGTSSWTNAASTRAAMTQRSVTISGLKPSTTYEYRVVCGDFVSEVMTFATEGTFTIPNASMEDWSEWSENSKVMIPAAGGVRSFWDSGNHGSSTMSVTLTQGSTDMKGSGSRSARLRSQFVGLGVAGKFAAGNLFVGKYLETQGTDGRLQFGQPYDGSHPSALRLKANYRPGVADKNGCKAGYLQLGDTDKAQIYVALATEPVEVRTKKSNQKLFDPKGNEILAYGQVTWESNFGPDGQLQEVTIPLEYYDRARSNEAKYLIIVCSASKFGDFFDGGEGSLMYVDDFELVY